jgi:RNA polymerase sigma factor (sigma-70 family)
MRPRIKMEYQLLIDKLGPTVRKITYKLSGSFSGFSQEDLYQECLLHLWEEFTGGVLQDKTDSYILQGCFFYLKNYIRVHRVKATCVSLQVPLCDRDDEPVQREMVSTEQDYRLTLHAKMLYETLISNGFTSREKDVLRLWKDALDTRQIGFRLGISHVRVVKLMASIREKCAREYNE